MKKYGNRKETQEIQENFRSEKKFDEPRENSLHTQEASRL